MHLATPRYTGDHPAAAPGLPVRLPPRGGRARPAGWPTRHAARRRPRRRPHAPRLRRRRATRTTRSRSSGTTARRRPARRSTRCSRRPRERGHPAALLRPPRLRRVDRAPRAATSRRRRPTSRASPTRSASSASPSMGASGGGPHALACAALLGDRVTGAVALAGLAPVHRGLRLVRRHGAPRRACAPPATAARRGRGTRRPTSSTRRASRPPTGRRFAGPWQSLGSDAMRGGRRPGPTA